MFRCTARFDEALATYARAADIIRANHGDNHIDLLEVSSIRAFVWRVLLLSFVTQLTAHTHTGAAQRGGGAQEARPLRRVGGAAAHRAAALGAGPDVGTNDALMSMFDVLCFSEKYHAYRFEKSNQQPQPQPEQVFGVEHARCGVLARDYADVLRKQDKCV